MSTEETSPEVVYGVGGKMWSFVSHMATAILCGLFLYLPLLIFGRIRIYGKENIPAARKHIKNTLHVMNHLSLYDSIWACFTLFFPRIFRRPFAHFPWQTPDKINFENFLPWVRCGKFFLIKRDKNNRRHDPQSMRFMERVLPHGMISMFPEGQRTFKAVQQGEVLLRTEHSDIPIGIPRLGVSRLIELHQPKIVPILVRNTDVILREGEYIPRPWRTKIDIVIGEPYDSSLILNELSEKGLDQKELLQQVANRVMNSVAELDTKYKGD